MRSLIDDTNARLTHGYRAREFEDADREPLVEAGNAENHPMERETADDWRRWESIQPDPARVRVTITDEKGRIAGHALLSAGGTPRPDGSQLIHVNVLAEHRGLGLGSALLETFEAEAGRREVPRLLAGVSEAKPHALRFADAHGYREIGRRITSFRELASFDPDAWRSSLERVEAAGIRLRSFTDVLAERDEAGRERFWHELWDAEGPMWDDIPFAAPTPHWPFEQFHALIVKSGQLLADASVVAYDGQRIAGFSLTGDRHAIDGYTWMTGVAREHRGHGVAMALKVSALTRAKAMGRRAMGTTNDEPNKAMRGVNVKLGYQSLPAHIELEKPLT